MHLSIFKKELSETLMLIFNSSWSIAVVTETCKKAIAVATFKKDERDDIGSYRLVTNLGKILETLIWNAISKAIMSSTI